MKRTRRASSGQATVEYILILFIAVTIGMLVLRDLVKPAVSKLSDHLSRFVGETLFDSKNFHRFRR